MVSPPTHGFEGGAVIVGVGLLAAALVTFALTGLVRMYLIRHRILDHPNHRSAHTVSTPRGGGLALAATVLAGIALFAAQRIVDGQVAAAIGGGGAAIVLVGWIDDRRGLSAGTRALVHVAAAAWAVWWVGGLPSIRLGSTTLSLGVGGSVFAVLLIAWTTNLYNFMDGIDGIAAVEAATVGGVAGALLLLQGQLALGVIAGLVAASSVGFLRWNWQPAKVFMGDCGSGFLGFVFGTLCIASEARGALPLVAWLIILGVFVFDATATLLRRVARGDPLAEAHRLHAYQRLETSGVTHAQISTLTIITSLALGSLAWLGIERPLLLPAIGAASLVGLAGLYAAIERRAPFGGGPQASSEPRR